MRRIYADFNSETEDGRIALHAAGSIESLVGFKEPPVVGERVVLHDDEMEVEAVLEEETTEALADYSKERRVWLGKVDESTWRETSSQPAAVASEFLAPVWEPLMERQLTG